MTCGTDIVAQRDADQRITYSLNGNYSFANLTPRLKVWQASGSVNTPFLTVTTVATVNGSVWDESEGALILTLDKLDLAALPEGDLLYDITLTDVLGFENPFCGGVFNLYDDGSETYGSCTNRAQFTVGGQCVSVSIQGGALGVSASLLLADLNAAVAASEAAAATAVAATVNKLNRDGTNPVAGLLANIGAVSSAALALNSGAGLVGAIQTGTGAVTRTQQSKNRDTVSVNDFGAVGDGVTDCTDAVNAAILAVFNAGGGKVTFGYASAAYKISGTIYVVSGVTIDCRGQTLIGAGGVSMFKTANVVAGAFVPITVFDPATVVTDAHILNVRPSTSSLVFDFIGFTKNCSVDGVYPFNCTQIYKVFECFYSSWSNIFTSPDSGGVLPVYHLMGANNGMTFIEVNAVVTNGWLIEGGTTSCVWINCHYEGGSLGFKFKNDCIGLTFMSCYGENITGTMWDFSEAATCNVSFFGNYINRVGISFDDGGATGTSSLTGVWDRSNSIVGIDGTYPGTFRLSSPRNFMHFSLRDNGDGLQSGLVVPPNFTLSLLSSVRFDASWLGNTLTDVRARAAVYGGVLDHRYSGNTGDVFPGSVPWSVIAFPTSATSTLTLDTKIKWNPTSVRATYILTIDDDGSPVDLYGDIYGVAVKQGDAVGKTVAATDQGGFVRLSLGTFNNTTGTATVTGTLRLLA